MSDLLLQLQNDLLGKLLSEPAFQYNAIATLRDMVISQEIEKRLPHLTLRPNGPTGKFGCGILINMPDIEGQDPSATALMGTWRITIDVIENPELNFGPQGTKTTCTEVGRNLRAFLDHFAIEGIGIFYQDKDVLGPIPDMPKMFPRCVGYRVSLRSLVKEQRPAKVTMPGLASPAETVTLTDTSGLGAGIYFTVDGSFPGPGNPVQGVMLPGGTGYGAGAGWFLYTGPFTVPSGTVVRAAAYFAGYAGSDIIQATII